MRVKGYFVGTASEDQQEIAAKSGKSFVAFKLESKGPKDQYPNRVKVMAYPDRCPKVTKGAIVVVAGEVSAESWINKADGTAKGGLKIFAESVEVHGASAAPEPKITQDDIPGVAAAKDDDGSIPF